MPLTDLDRDATARLSEWLKELVDGASLTPRGEALARFAATNPRFVAFRSATAVAERTGDHPATVVRFAQRLGFSGWTEFQLHFRHHYLGTLSLEGLLRDQKLSRSTDQPVHAALERDIQNLQAVLASIDAKEVHDIARAIAQSRRTLVISAGSYAAIGHVFAHLARFMGYDVTLEARGGAHIVAALTNLRAGDCLVAVSFWRLFKDIVLATQHCQERDITTIVITDSIFSPLANDATHVITVPTESISFFQSSTAALSVVYGLLGELSEIGGARVTETVRQSENLYDALDVLFD